MGLCFLQYGATRVEVDIDGTLTYPEPLPLNGVKDKGNALH